MFSFLAVLHGKYIQSRFRSCQERQKDKEFLKQAERLRNCLPPGDRDVSKLSSNMEHAHFLAPEKQRLLQSKAPHTCGIRHVKGVRTLPTRLYISVSMDIDISARRACCSAATG